jgi:hypothetical protein
MVTNFAQDMDFTRKAQRIFTLPWYKTIAKTVIPLNVGRMAEVLQYNLDVDVLLLGMKGKNPDQLFGVEEKIRRGTWNDLLLETMSCTVPDHKSKGWMCYGRADWLLYAFHQGKQLDCHLYDFMKLRTWFWEQLPSRKTTWERRVTKQRNRTASRVVPFSDLPAGVEIDHFVLLPGGKQIAPRQ